MFDLNRLRAELAHIHRSLCAVAATREAELRRDLSGMGGTTPALVWLTLFADCLRVTVVATEADGEVTDAELDSVFDLLFTIARHYAATCPGYARFEASDLESARQFLTHYTYDTGPFGARAKHPWPGLALCRRAAELGVSEPVERYESLMGWLLDAACQSSGIDEHDPRRGHRLQQLSDLRAQLANTVAGAVPGPDSRLAVFLGSQRVFHSVQDPASLNQADPFDVETIHREARAAFEELVQHAKWPAQHSERGRMLLVLGDSGAGKTHLLRAFRRHVQEYGRGFVAYAQLHSSSEDYSRYLLQQVITSLGQPYSGVARERTGLYELAMGLPRFGGSALESRVRRLTDEDWPDHHTLAEHINHIVDDLLRFEELAPFDPDLLRVLLYSLRPDHHITSRVYKYLRCEDLNTYDRGKIGEVIPRTGPDHPRAMLRDLARLAFTTQEAAFVLMVDQAELAGFDDSSHAVFRRAIDALYGVVSEVPSAIAVIACLSDLYRTVRTRLTRSAVDRLESDPPVQYLSLGRSYEEIEAMVARRLAWLYAQHGAGFRADDPVYPFTPEFLRRLVNQRSRQVLDRCHELQRQCSAAGRLIDQAGADHDGPLIDVEPLPDDALLRLSEEWLQLMHGSHLVVPDDDAELLELLAVAARQTARELGLDVIAQGQGVLRVVFSQRGRPLARAALAITNKSPKGGHFAKQLAALHAGADGLPPVAVRVTDFPTSEKATEELSKLLRGGGRKQFIPDASWRLLLASRELQARLASNEELLTRWLRAQRPVSSQAELMAAFGLTEWLDERSSAPEEPERGSPQPASSQPQQPPPSQPQQPPPSRPQQPPPAPVQASLPLGPSPTKAAPERGAPPESAPHATLPHDTPLHLGTSTGFQPEPRSLDTSTLLRHLGILGSSGSGKTTLALNLLEQLLERDIAVVLVDRKGDLAGYAKPDWWTRADDPARAKRLADKLDVRLFTPGSRAGRPLSLPVVPELNALPEHERERMVQYAASSLAAMMHLGDSPTDSALRALLAQAIAVLAERAPQSGLEQLLSLLEERDDVLVSRASRYDDRLYKKLVQHLETLRLNDRDLFDAQAEVLSGETLLARRQPDRVPLVIASTRFLGETERVQSWVASLITALARHVTRHPSAELRTVFMIDEADQFLPAGTSRPPSKEPLQDLLKRARSAGLGVMLASQSPGDFDYKSRELINTWFLGRIADAYAIEKMRPLFERRPQVRSKLAGLEAGRFFLLQEGQAMELARKPSLLRTEQLSEQELLELARMTLRT